MPSLAAFPKGFFMDLVERRMSLFQWLDLAATLGVDGVELYPRFFESMGKPYLDRVRWILKDDGLEMPMLCHSPDFTRPDASRRQTEVEETRRMIALAAELGGGFCRVLSGQNRPGLDPEEAHGWVVDCLTALLPDAQGQGIVLVMENHYKDGLWHYPEFAQSHARYLAILDAVDSPWLKAQYDPSNAIVAGEDQYALLARVLPRLATVQASDRYLEGGTVDDLRRLSADAAHGYAPFLRHGVIGRGLNDYDRIFSTLAGAGFDGWISIEDGEGETVDQGMANLHESVAFLRGTMARHFSS
ncbi:MAG TPA: sugar phosphate isomerase/epimerase family protein [Vicinamibacteria bacterium]|nr:sugar phosphate isomerase/epimerase family protein [Vicinamibacteria bacterium]